MNKRMFVLVNKYPNIIEPNACVFIQSLIWELSDMGLNCNIICPLPVNLNLNYLKFPKKKLEKTENGNYVRIFYPKYLSLGQSGSFLQKTRVKITTFLYTNACNRILKNQKLNNEFDVLYSHFICPSGVAAAILGKKYHLKSYMGFGESIYQGDSKYGNKYLKKIFANLNGVVAVSTQNKNYLQNAGVIGSNKVEIFPNGYRQDRFYLIDKNKARDYFGWDKDKFIVGFCGSFDERKGILRLEEAINSINKDNIVFACAGKGKLIPTSNKCILKRAINNDELVYFYNAIDVFVLPTQNEGCCNAIVEAMACGCAIISSDREFNYDILDKKNAILINPNNISDIKKAILTLFKNKKKLLDMKKSSYKKSKDLILNNRAKKIIEFMNK